MLRRSTRFPIVLHFLKSTSYLIKCLFLFRFFVILNKFFSSFFLDDVHATSTFFSICYFFLLLHWEEDWEVSGKFNTYCQNLLYCSLRLVDSRLRISIPSISAFIRSMFVCNRARESKPSCSIVIKYYYKKMMMMMIEKNEILDRSTGNVSESHLYIISNILLPPFYTSLSQISLLCLVFYDVSFSNLYLLSINEYKSQFA